MSRRTTVAALAGAIVLGALVTGVRADDTVSGTYSLDGREKSGWFNMGPKHRSTLWVALQPRRHLPRGAHVGLQERRPGHAAPGGQGHAQRQRARRELPAHERPLGRAHRRGRRPALPCALHDHGQRPHRRLVRVAQPQRRPPALQRERPRGAAQTWPEGGAPPTTTTTDTTTPPTTTEPTQPVTPPTSTDTPGPVVPGGLADDVRVDRPVSGRVFLFGQPIPLTLVPADAQLTIEGPARRDGQNLVITGPGQVKLTARHANKTSRQVTVEGTTAEVVEVTVADSIAIADAPARTSAARSARPRARASSSRPRS